MLILNKKSGGEGKIRRSKSKLVMYLRYTKVGIRYVLFATNQLIDWF